MKARGRLENRLRAVQGPFLCYTKSGRKQEDEVGALGWQGGEPRPPTPPRGGSSNDAEVGERGQGGRGRRELGR